LKERFLSFLCLFVFFPVWLSAIIVFFLLFLVYPQIFHPGSWICHYPKAIAREK